MPTPLPALDSRHGRETTDGVRVLLVDDDPDVADLTAELLAREDDRFEIETAVTPDEGLARIRDGAFDCVVSGYEMPGRNGIELLEAVRETRPELPVILYTGKGSEAVAADAIAAGVTDYLQKESGTSQYAVLANRIGNAVDQYRSRQRVEESQKRLSLFIEQSPVGVIEWNEAFEVRMANEVAEETLGYTAAELRGRSWRSIVPESEEAVVGAVVSEVLAAEGGRHTVNENVRKDGDRIVCEWHNRVITDDGGDVVAIFSQFWGVTERERRKRNLAFFKELVEAVGVGVGVYGDDGRFEYVNDAYASLLNTDRQALVGEPIWRVNPAFDPDRFSRYWDSLDTGETRIDETVHRFGDAEVSVQAVTTCRVLAGTTYHFGTVTDISERKRREAELRRQNERLDEFAGVVSHDLRNPLNVAEGRLSLVAEECDSDHIDDVEGALARMSELIDDLLTLARSDGQVGELRSVALREITRRCWRTVDTADATLTVTADRRVSADPSRLRQLLENLMRNAVEHGGDDVTVTVGELADGFYVEDDGAGIPDDEREAVFEAGYTTDRRGTGFGLSIASRVAAVHGWDIDVADGADGGTRFEITGVEFVDE